MGQQDARIDAYIEKVSDFARPILLHIRELVHKACPEVQEKIKWGFPNFEYKGILCNMAAFKHHCTFGFWKAALMTESEKLKGNNEHAMGHLGQIKTLKDMPPDKTMIRLIKEAMALNDAGAKLPPRKKIPSTEPVVIPLYFAMALKKNKVASTSFEKLSPSHRREYVQWLLEAKTEETRNKRMATALEWISEGKARNWKYERC